MVNRQIKHKLLWSLLGYGLPLGLALLTIPWLIHHMGTENFALLTLAWVLIGFAGIFDFGVGKALTREIARRLAQQKTGTLWSMAQFTFLVMVIVSILIYGAFYLSTPWLLTQLRWQSVSSALAHLDTIRLLLLAIPLVLLSSIFIALLEGVGSVKRLNVIRALTNALILVVPVGAWWCCEHLWEVMLALVLVRVLSLGLYVLGSLPYLFSWHAQRSAENWSARTLLVAGGWMNGSTVLEAVFNTLDRFMIGALLSVQQVTYYTTPIDMLMKLQFIPRAFMSVMFPAFSASYETDYTRLQQLFWRSGGLLLILSGVVATIIMLLGNSLLALWIDADFAQQAAPVLYWSALALLLANMAYVPLGLLQAVGKAHWPVRVNLLELPIYLWLLYWSIHSQGIVGASMVLALRYGSNALSLLTLCAYALPNVRVQAFRLVFLLIVWIGWLGWLMP